MTAFTIYASSTPVAERKPTAKPAVKASYDAARTTPENRRHWQNADNFSATTANTPEVRRRLRNRARYETANDGYAAGLVRDLAADVIGSGPSLLGQLENDKDNRLVEDAWHEWCDATNFYDKLRMAEENRIVDGEAFLLQATSEHVRSRSGVSLDLLPIEADQVADPPGTARPFDPLADDGVRIDKLGYPVTYTVLDRHPGDKRGVSLAGRSVAAERMVHWFRRARPGQLRGVTELTTALTILPLHRRYTQATVTAAEVAARFAVLLQSKLPVPDDDTVAATAGEFEQFELPEIGGMTLPAGYDATQIKPEHPTSSFSQFDDSIIRRMARGTQMPYGGAAGDHSKYNYSSAKLELWIRFRRRNILRDQLRITVLDPIFRMWYLEARLNKILPSPTLSAIERLPHRWQYDADPSLDPLKDASADDSRLRNGTATYADLLGERGLDWREQLRKTAEIADMAESLGLKGLAEIYRGNVPAGQPVPVPPVEDPTPPSPDPEGGAS
jgi:lambda family phage portal protein